MNKIALRSITSSIFIDYLTDEIEIMNNLDNTNRKE